MENKITYEWNDTKNQDNQQKHGVAFEQIENFDWSIALTINTTRDEDQESRFKAIGPIGNRLHTIVFTNRELNVRIISFRPSNNAEIRKWNDA